jgi:ABC-type lipoprotein export system ATPase subunit
MTPANALIQLRGVGLEVFTPASTRILHPLDLDVVAGSSVTISGPSGAGKTTLASIIGALQPPSEGAYRFAGSEMVGSSKRDLARFRSTHLGFVFQHSHLIEERSSIANVALGITDQTMSRQDRDERCEHVLDLVGLAGLAGRRAGDLSGGERHRVAIARALAKSPSVLIADEPTAALDQHTGQAILDLLAQVTARGATLIIVTHDVRAAEVADQVVSIVDGRRV